MRYFFWHPLSAKESKRQKKSFTPKQKMVGVVTILATPPSRPPFPIIKPVRSKQRFCQQINIHPCTHTHAHSQHTHTHAHTHTHTHGQHSHTQYTASQMKTGIGVRAEGERKCTSTKTNILPQMLSRHLSRNMGTVKKQKLTKIKMSNWESEEEKLGTRVSGTKITFCWKLKNLNQMLTERYLEAPCYSDTNFS